MKRLTMVFTLLWNRIEQGFYAGAYRLAAQYYGLSLIPERRPSTSFISPAAPSPETGKTISLPHPPAARPTAEATQEATTLPWPDRETLAAITPPAASIPPLSPTPPSAEEGRRVEDKAAEGVRRMAQQLKAFMEENYELRRNLLRGGVEYRQRGGKQETAFRSLTQEVLNDMTFTAHEEGIPLWDRDVKRYVHSNRVEAYDPAAAYLAALPKWNGFDHIGALAATIPTENPHWKQYFRRWFLAMVHQWMPNDGRGHAADVLPVLVGEQGLGKSYWCRHLLPPELADYFNESLGLDTRRETERALSNRLLINIDEFDSIPTSRHPYLKHLLQLPAVSLRRSYREETDTLPRRASFIGCCNHPDLFTDTSGNRRFIGIEVTGIIGELKIDYPQLYAQAAEALANGEQHWFGKEEEALFGKSNEAFELRTVEEQELLLLFRPAKEGEAEGCWMMAIEVVHALQKANHLRIPPTRARSFGRQLRKYGFQSKHTHRGTEFFMVAA